MYTVSECILYKWGCFTVQSPAVQQLHFKLRLQEDDFTELLAMQPEELINEEIHSAGNGRRFPLSEQSRSVFEVQDPNADRSAAAVQNAPQPYRVIYEEEKRVTSLYRFSLEGW